MTARRAHELKCLTSYFDAILDGRKTFEVRLNDRDFRVGDELWLRDWNGVAYSGRSVRKLVTFIIDADAELLPPSVTGVADGHVVMALGPVLYPSLGVPHA